MTRLGIVFAALSLIACGGGDEDESVMAGIWEVTSWTDNQLGCDSPGEPVLDSGDSAYFAVLDQDFGTRYVTALRCSDLDECRALRDDTGTLHFGEYTFESGSDDEGWSNHAIYALGGSGPPCDAEVITNSMRLDGDSLVLETVHVDVFDFPGADDGSCPLESAVPLAADAPCTRLELITAARIE